MNCLECLKKCIGQTRTLTARYKKHIYAVRNNKPDEGYSRHILDREHTFRSVDDTMAIIRKATKEKCWNSLKKYHIFLLVNTGHT
jgi:hypothetical protein